MRVVIYYLGGEEETVEQVQMLRIVGPHLLETQLLGGGAVLHENVLSFTMHGAFAFPNLEVTRAIRDQYHSTEIR